MDPRTTGELIAAAVAEEGIADDDIPEGGLAVAVLQARGTRDVLDAALDLCVSGDPRRRKVGATILGELGRPERTFPQECCDALLSLVNNDADSAVVVQAIFRLGQLGNRHCIPALTPLHTADDEDIRHGVAFALAGCRADSDTPEAVAALLQLANDSYLPARDWATTALAGTLSLDGSEIRQCLLQRAADEDPLIRAEALKGLASRHDERVLPHLIRDLSTESGDHLFDNAWPYFIDAAQIYLGRTDDPDTQVDELIAALRRIAS